MPFLVPLLQILYEVIAPMFVLIGIGFVVQKRLGLELKTLTRLNFWIFVPGFLFVRIYESTLTWGELRTLFLHFAIFFPLLGALVWLLSGALKYPDRMRRALTASAMFYNSGNYGIPVARLAFPHSVFPEQVQAAMVMLQNFSNFTVGIYIMAGGRGQRRRDTLREVFKLPMIYVLVIAWTLRLTHLTPPFPVMTALHWLADGLVPVAVVTLGAQMAGLRVPRFNRALLTSLSLRLGFAPVLSYFVIWLVGARGELGQALLISSSFPTAVNSALLALEYDNEPEFAAAAVFYSTLVSSVTVSCVIYAARVWLF